MQKLLSPKLLHNYQLRAFNKILNLPNVGLFLEMGLGKTVTVLSAIQYLKFDRFQVNKVLIIAPLRVAKMVWKQEAAGWEHTKNLKFSLIIGNEKQRLAGLRAEADVYIINIDNVPWLTAKMQGNWPFDMLVIDESSKIKNHASRRFKALKIIRPLTERVVLLTGTPRPQSICDLWSQIYMLDGGERLGQSITAFRQMFLKSNDVYGAPSHVKKYTADNDGERRIYDRIKDICISMRAKDYIELPERRDIDIAVPITEPVMNAYKDFERDKVLELLEQDEAITAVNAAALSMKLRQFANGAVYYEKDNGFKSVHAVHNLKLEALNEILEDAEGDPVLCFYAFKHDRDRIMNYCKKYKPVHLKHEKDFEDWNAGKIKLGLGHLASMGHGLNLQKAPAKNRLNIVFFSPDWNLDNVLQGITRIYRQGLKCKLFVYRIILSNTIDHRIIESNEAKDEGQQALMSYISHIVKRYKNK